MTIRPLLLLLLLVINPCMADGVGKIYKSKPVPKNIEKVVPHTRPGALLPWKTWNDWDGKDRPKYWNGYGVDPSGVNYYHYFDRYPCAYEFTKDWPGCRLEEETPNNNHDVPEPSIVILLIPGILCLLKRGLYGAGTTNKKTNR